jgi:hypothetical protein
MAAFHGRQISPQAYGCFLVAARAESSAIRKLITHWRYADSLGNDKSAYRKLTHCRQFIYTYG